MPSHTENWGKVGEKERERFKKKYSEGEKQSANGILKKGKEGKY